MQAYEKREKYEICNNAINQILKEINIEDLDLDEEIENMFQKQQVNS